MDIDDLREEFTSRADRRLASLRLSLDGMDELELRSLAAARIRGKIQGIEMTVDAFEELFLALED